MYYGKFHGSIDHFADCLKVRFGYDIISENCSETARGIRLTAPELPTLDLVEMPDVQPLPLFVDCDVVGVLTNGPTSATFKTELRAELHKVEELDSRIVELNPICAEVATRTALRQKRSRVLIVIREHLLLEKINIVDGLMAAGIQSQEILFVGKTDKSMYRDRVSSALLRRDIVFFKAIPELVQHLNTIHPHPSQCVVVDDGGDMVVALYENGLLSSDTEVIETTTKGVKTLQEKCPNLNFENLAGGLIKVQQSRAIAASCIYRIRQLLRHKHLERRRALVVGYGQIGIHIADVLSTLGMTVDVCDVSEAKRIEANISSFDTYPSVKAAVASQPYAVIIGCTGTQSIRLEDFDVAKQDDFYLSAISSNDLMALRQELAEQAKRHNSAKWFGDQISLQGGRNFNILGHGGSINLFHDEGVSEPEFDIFNAKILEATLISARRIVAPPPMLAKTPTARIAELPARFMDTTVLAQNNIRMEK